MQQPHPPQPPLKSPPAFSSPHSSAHDVSTKTVFVLDHTQYFGISSETLIDLDFGKPKATGHPLPPISKSLWTCAVEASVEYCRIVWDLFPAGKLIRFVVSDSNAHIVNTWNPNTQTMQHVMNAMSLVGIPPRITPQSNDYSVIHGLRAAAEALAEPNEEQLHQQQQYHQQHHHAVDKSAASPAAGAAALPPPQPANAGRVICITSARDNASMKSLEDIFMTLVVQQNQMTAGRRAAAAADTTAVPQLLNIDRCHFCIINVYPCRVESMVSDRAAGDLSTVLQTEIHSVRASDLPHKMTHLILPHYDLASTTVTGIPMKEEQNASSSANYDVEIFHARHAHAVLQGSSELAALPVSRKEGHHYETVTLKWCTPRGGGASEMQPCVAQHRVTPVDVTSRPSSCLINFLLNGRSVLLEMPRGKTGAKLNSHLLSAHGGEIFIHTLQVARSCLEDPPSILEGCGGRVTDYRITDFAAVAQTMRLQPLRAIAAPAADGEAAAEQATPVRRRQPDETLRRVRQRLHERTPYWPLTLGSTVLFNVRQFVEPLLALAARDRLSADDVLQCRQVVFNLVARETRLEQLPLPAVAQRARGAKREEQYRLLWQELEALLAGGPSSAEHRALLQYVRECFRAGHPMALLDGAGEQDAAGAATAATAAATAATRRNILVHKSTTDSPWSPPLAKVAAMGGRGK